MYIGDYIRPMHRQIRPPRFSVNTTYQIRPVASVVEREGLQFFRIQRIPRGRVKIEKVV
jgi:hypothetical protein